MKEAIKEFLKLYVNSSNAFLIISAILLILFLAYFITWFFGTGSLKKINRVLKEEIGDDIIRRIEGLRLSRRFENMWDDYYTAYSSEKPVALSSYLIKNDMLLGKNIFRMASRLVAFCGFSATVIGVLNIDGLFEAEKTNLTCLFFALLSLQAFFEFLYAVLDFFKKKRIVRLLEEFETLSLRKLPGKAVSFEASYVLDKLNELDERIDSVRSGVNQLNARMDRQYKFLENTTEKTDK